MSGIRLVKQKEYYTSQCSPLSNRVSKKYATKNKRIKRGLYKDGNLIFNADAVGAYNILRLYAQQNKLAIDLPIDNLSNPKKVSV